MNRMESHGFVSDHVTEPCSERINWIQLRLENHKISDVVDESTLLAAKIVWIYFPDVKVLSNFSTKRTRKVLSYRSKCSQSLVETLSRMGVPDYAHPKVIENVFSMLDEAVSPERPIKVLCVDVSHVTDRSSLSTADDVYDMVTRESTETYRPNFIPATTSSIEGLEKVTFEDGLELEAVTRSLKPSCVICMKSLEPRRRRRRLIGGIKKKKKKKTKKRPMMITLSRLPCFHHFHADCIAKWLGISHSCPVCRYSMPAAEVAGEPS